MNDDTGAPSHDEHDGADAVSAVSSTRITAGELTQEHVGRFVWCHDPTSGANYGAEILRITRRDEGKAAGVSIWLRHPSLPSGRRTREGQAHVRFGDEFELIDLTAD